MANQSAEWTKILIHPFCLTGYILVLIFGLLARAKLRKSKSWLYTLAFLVAGIALFGVLGLVYWQVEHHVTMRSTPIPAPRQEKNHIQQSSSGAESPNVQDVQDGVTIIYPNTKKTVGSRLGRTGQRVEHKVIPGSAHKTIDDSSTYPIDAKGRYTMHGGDKSAEKDGMALSQTLDDLPLGQVIFHHPAEMEVRKAEVVQVRISQTLSEDIAKGISRQGVTEQDQIPVSMFMKVHLSGDPYFEVKAINDDAKQVVTRNGFTEWSFTVLPLKRGKWPLHLVIAAVIRTPWGTEAYKDYPVKDEFVSVRVTVFGAIESFLLDNWQWLWTTILIPLAGWLWSRRRKLKGKAIATNA